MLIHSGILRSVLVTIAVSVGIQSNDLVFQNTTSERKKDHWQMVTQDKQLTVSVEPVLYTGTTQDRFFVRVRVNNRTMHRVGLDLDFRNSVYPNQWACHLQNRRIIIDESRRAPVPETEAIKKRLMIEYESGGLTFLEPHSSVTYLRGFHGPTGRQEIEKAAKERKFLILSMDGHLFYTDGKTTGRLGCEWKGDFDSEDTDLVLKLPLTWRDIPKSANVVVELGRD